MKVFICKVVFVCSSLFLIQCKPTIISTQYVKEQKEKDLLIENVQIFDGIHQALTTQDVFIQKGIIKKLGKNISVPTNTFIIDGTGKTLMPGLVDAHVHLGGNGSVPWEKNIIVDEATNLSAYLYCGITTVYDLGGVGTRLENIAQRIENNELLGPRVFHAHIPITVKNSHPIPQAQQTLPWPLKNLIGVLTPTIKKEKEANKIIAQYLKNEVDYIKVVCDQIPPGYPEMNFEQLKALVQASHKQGLKVFVHVGSPENAVNAAKAGADILAHGVWRGQLSEEQASIIADANIPIVYTLSAFHSAQKIHLGYFQPSYFDKLLVDESILSPIIQEKGLKAKERPIMGAFLEDLNIQSKYWWNNFQLLKEKGVTMIVGTDSSTPGSYAGSSYFKEIDRMKEYGLSNFEILQGATYYAARLFLENPTFGSIEEGKSADLLLLNGNPLKDINNIKTPHLIIAKGIILEKKK